MKYTYYTLEGEDFCVKTELVNEFELDCKINGLVFIKRAASNSVESLRNFSSMYCKKMEFEVCHN